MGTQKNLALKEVRSFHHGCQVYTWVDPVEKGLNLQPGLEKTAPFDRWEDTFYNVQKSQGNACTLVLPDQNFGERIKIERRLRVLHRKAKVKIK